MDKYSDWKYRDKRRYRAIQRMGRINPSARHDAICVRRQMIICWFWFIVMLPLTILWLPFFILGFVAQCVTDFVMVVEQLFFKLLKPKEHSFKKLHDLKLRAEHGIDYKRPHIMKDVHGWNYPSWHYVNRDD